MSAQKPSLNFDDLIACANGETFGDANGRLPAPPMLMFDRITDISKTGGKYGKGALIAELDIKPDLWFFDCHFRSDPVMPGCLGLDAMWQLVGFYLLWLGHPGRGRALGANNIRFSGQVLPHHKCVRYEVDMKRIINRNLIVGIGEARMLVDDTPIYEADGLRVGLFTRGMEA